MTFAPPAARADYASRLKRLLGQLADGIIAFTPILAVIYLVKFEKPGDLLIVAAALLAGVAYILLADGTNGGRSIGKRWLDMRVVDARTGAPCTLIQSVARNILHPFLGPLDWLFIFGRRRQRLGDIIAGTVVVDA